MRELGTEKFYVELLEEKEVDNRQAQLKLETEWQEQSNSELNQRRAQSLPEKKLEIARKYKADHADKIKSDWAKYSEKNRAELNKREKKYREDNKQLLRNKVAILEKKRLQRERANSDSKSD